MVTVIIYSHKIMKRVQGPEDVRLIECVNPVKGKWRVRWDVATIDGATSYMEEEYQGKPSVDMVRQLILSWMNDRIDETILSGFTYDGHEVWLSQENQFNYKSAYDLAVQTQGKTLPVTFKLGTDDKPSYATFDSVEKLQDFYTKAVGFIQQTLAEGWKKKDSIDFSKYA